MSIHSAAIIGSGNVASHLATWLNTCGILVKYVYSPTPHHAEVLANQVGATVLTTLQQFPSPVDLVVIAVNDKAIEKVAEQLLPTHALVVHTSGITSMSVLDSHSRTGVLYPLQTLSKHTPIAAQQAPFLLEARSKEDLGLLTELVARMGSIHHLVNSEQRKVVHLAAVFANNFGNHLNAIAAHILETHQLSFDFIRPLILETARKVQTRQPSEVQTGPAVRNDGSTIAEHLRLLMELPHYRQLYELISTSIHQQHSND